MPPKTSISRLSIEDAAFEIVRRKGADALSVRRIAEVLGCSTQPVYTACGSMASVKDKVAARAKAMIERQLTALDSSAPPFLQIGLASLRLAQDEPHLFKLAGEYMRDRVGMAPPERVLAAMRADRRLAALSDEQLSRIHTLMWIFSQGLATLLGPGSPVNAMSMAQGYLRLAGEAVIAFEERAGTP